MNPEEFLDWLLSLTGGIPGFGETIINFISLNGWSVFFIILLLWWIK